MAKPSEPDPLLPSADDPWGYRDRRAVVTGAASGIGHAVGTILVALGAEVVGVDVRPIDLAGLAETYRVDLASWDAIDDAANAIGGPVDALFNCAGIPGTAPARSVLAVNFVGLRRLTERVATMMTPGSAICSIGSTSAINWPYHVDAYLEMLAVEDDDATLDWLEARLPELGDAYNVSKEAVDVYTTWRSVGFNAFGIRINCINPGGTETPARSEMTSALVEREGAGEMLEHWPELLGRMAHPGEQAWPMVFLNSPFASFVNGASFYVDAGLTSGLITRQHHPSIAAGMAWRPPQPSPPT